MNDLSRRSFIKIVAGTGASLMLGGFASAVFGEEAPGGEDFAPNVFIKIDPDGLLTVTVSKSDMGQGVRTAFAMLVAEELDADWTKIKVVQAPGNSATYGSQGTGGSSSTRSMNRKLRTMAATTRLMLVAAAAAKWGVDAATLRTENGKVIGPSGKSLAYGALTAAAKAIPVPTDVTLKPKSGFTILGKPTKMLDAADIVTGKGIFGNDVHVEGALYAVLMRPPTFGASPSGIDDSATRKVAGVVDVIQIGSGIAVLATNTWAALKGRSALKATWSTPNAAVSSASLREDLKKAVGDHQPMPAGAKVKEATYELPYLAHATMETLNAVADVREGSAEIWSGSQSPDSAQNGIARTLGIPAEKVVMHTMRLGGGFGRKFSNEWIMEAVELSRRAKKPVKLLWTRECDMQHDSYRPMSHHSIKGAVDAAGNAVGWSHQYLTAPGRRGDGYTNGTYLPYAIPDAAMRSGGVGSPIPTGPWRSVEHSHLIVANECFIDELATLAGQDPYDFRRKMVRDDRLRKVLESVAAKSGWGTSLPKGAGRGIACFSGYGSCIAHVVEVMVADNRIKVTKMVAVVDPGIAVNPQGVEAQVQGGFMDGLATALHAAINIEGGGAAENNWDGYVWARMSDAPKMQVYVEAGGNDFGGMGEVGYPSAPAAIANAVFVATGKRVRKFPIKLEELV